MSLGEQKVTGRRWELQTIKGSETQHEASLRSSANLRSRQVPCHRWKETLKHSGWACLSRWCGPVRAEPESKLVGDEYLILSCTQGICKVKWVLLWSGFGLLLCPISSGSAPASVLWFTFIWKEPGFCTPRLHHSAKCISWGDKKFCSPYLNWSTNAYVPCETSQLVQARGRCMTWMVLGFLLEFSGGSLCSVKRAVGMLFVQTVLCLSVTCCLGSSDKNQPSHGLVCLCCWKDNVAIY